MGVEREEDIRDQVRGMAKPRLAPPYDSLESDIIDTLEAGVNMWIGGNYPKSRSDWQGAVRALLSMYDVKRRPLAINLPEM